MEPLPPVKEVEYRCYISKIFEELSGSEYMTFAFETAKEFSSFRYEIAVRYRIQPGLLEFKVLGMTATRTMMPSFGTARSVLKVPLLPLGVYTVRMIKSDGTENLFAIEVSKRGFQILQPIPRKRFIDLVVENKAAAPGARNLSTVTKAPPTPLVPRTIQKRQPLPMTPEELAIAAALIPETAEEREAREEHEIFGGDEGSGHSRKASAKHSIDEIEEVPENAKQESLKSKLAKAAQPELKPKPKKEKNVEKKPEPKPKAEKKPEKKLATKSTPVKQSASAKKTAPAKAKPKPKAPPKKSAPKPAAKKPKKKK